MLNEKDLTKIEESGLFNLDGEVTLEVCEADIETADKIVDMAYYVKGVRLRQIKESKLYLDGGYDNWVSYCNDKWEIAKPTANQLIQTANVVDNIKTDEAGTPAFHGKVLPKSQIQALPLAKLPPEEQPAAWQKVIDKADKDEVDITGPLVAEVVKTIINPEPEIEPQPEPEDETPDWLGGEVEVATENIDIQKPHVSHNSGNNEWYTPPKFIESARKVMGGIDLDPASSDIANKTVKATSYYTKDTNGLDKEWLGRVWMNPPYQGDLIGKFAQKMVESNVEQFIVLVNNATETKWFQNISKSSNAICFPLSRVRFLDPDGNPGAPLQGQAIIYSGKNVEQFIKEFNKYGFSCEVIK